jgi:hypothetical protein
MRNAVVLLVMLAALAGCQNVTIKPSSDIVVRDTPNYQDTRNFFFWGLMGEERVNVTEVCNDERVAQMQSQQTFVNGLLGAITLGIYAPHSVRVWCEDAILSGGAA